MFKRLLFQVVFMLSAAASSFAQKDDFRFSSFDAAQGLSHNQIKTFYKDSQGFLWIGTISGLNRYDGYNIRVFRNDPRSPVSISSDYIDAISEDPDGRLWIQTNSGIDIYDPENETFRNDPEAAVQAWGLPDANLKSITRDASGNFWFIHRQQGLFYFNSGLRKTSRISHKGGDTSSPASDSVSQVVPVPDGGVWIIHTNGIIEMLDARSLAVTYRSSAVADRYNFEVRDFRFIVDNEQDPWVYVADSNDGIYHLDRKTEKLEHLTSLSTPVALSSDIVRGIVQDNNNMIWVATDHGGITMIHKKKRSVRYLLNAPEDPQSLAQNSINCLYKDTDGIIWAGTFKSGVSYYHEKIIRFPLYKHSEGNPSSLPFDDINAFAEDEKGNLWIGTNGGGLIYFDRSTNKFRQYLHKASDPSSVSSNIIVSLCYDHNRVLWIGTYFGGMNSFDGKSFKRYNHVPGDTTSLSDNSVWEIYEDSDYNLWIGTLTHGVDLFDEQRRKVANFSNYRPNTLNANYITAFLETKDGEIWIGTGYGITIYNRQDGTFNHVLSRQNDPSSLSNNAVLSLLEDSRGMIWIGTHGGLDLYLPERNTFRAFTIDDGLPHNSILTLVEDGNRNFWMSTPNGLSNMVVSFQGDSLIPRFVNYDHFDGLQAKQFNENGVLKTWKGELAFSGSNGFNLFHPNDIPSSQLRSPVVLTSLEILNRSVRTGESLSDRIVLDKAVSLTREISLKPGENVFSLEFAALSFYHPEKTIYKYKLEGFNREWITTTAAQRKVTYTNLDPGDYVFRVMASNNDGVWSEKGLELKIRVLPPFWKTWYAMGIYVALVFAALLLTRRLIQQRERMKYIIEQERLEARRMHELDMMKIKFFTNVSHEFRTPLSLILTPVERMLKKAEDPVQRSQYQLIYRNARRLLNLVNQLLDFRKLEVQEIRFNPSEGDIIRFIRETVFSFSDLSEKKNIEMNFTTTVETIETVFDQDKLEKILFNLLSNAFKFTPQNGRIDIEADLPSPTELVIRVKDTGIGIPADKLGRVFDRFFQSDLPETMVNQGSGIGLSITREFVKAHGGNITVSSEVGKGSCFTVLLPVREVSEARRIEVPQQGDDITEAVHEHDHTTAGPRQPVLLLVEDNEDFRFYLKDNLRVHYSVIEASNGKEGWSKAITGLPDLVISDIMMPGMNGIELCTRIKNDQRVSHIPVILLTARNAEEQKLEGFESGADDYITKPFSFEILLSRIRNLIHQRELFQKEFRNQIAVKASNIRITSLDEQLIQKAIAAVEEKIAEPDFTVEDLSRELAMSRVHLYKKLHALTGKSPLEFIRTIRLQRAAQLLEESQLTVSEVAYKVGFNNPKYFARYFREQYNVLPSAYASGKRKS